MRHRRDSSPAFPRGRCWRGRCWPADIPQPRANATGAGRCDQRLRLWTDDLSAAKTKAGFVLLRIGHALAEIRRTTQAGWLRPAGDRAKALIEQRINGVLRQV